MSPVDIDAMNPAVEPGTGRLPVGAPTSPELPDLWSFPLLGLVGAAAVGVSPAHADGQIIEFAAAYVCAYGRCCAMAPHPAAEAT